MARELADLSQEQLGAAAGVTAAAVSQYERSLATPSLTVLQAFALRLDVPLEFFVAEERDAELPAYFRSLRAAPAAERRKARNYVQLVYELVVHLEASVKFPAYDLPRHPLDPADDRSPAERAIELRAAWAVPAGPIENMVRLAERHGVVVARLASGHDQIDAFSVPFTDRPVVVMSGAKGKRDRSRFDVAHELGHLMMHSPGAPITKQLEGEAHAFAAEFLMPAHSIFDELPSGLDWEGFFDLKRRWQVSIASLLYRAKTLGKVSDRTFTQGMKTISARGWRRHEPVDLGLPESPVLLMKAIEVAGLTEQSLSSNTAIPPRLLRSVLEWASDERPTVII